MREHGRKKDDIFKRSFKKEKKKHVCIIDILSIDGTLCPSTELVDQSKVSQYHATQGAYCSREAFENNFPILCIIKKEILRWLTNVAGGQD